MNLKAVGIIVSVLAMGSGMPDDTLAWAARAQVESDPPVSFHALNEAWHSGTDVVRLTDTKDLILEKARKRLSDYFSSGDYRFDIAARWIPRSLLSQESGSIEAVEIKGEVRRYTDFEVLYRHRGNRERASIQLAVDIERKLPVVVRRISRGEVIEGSDLEEQWVSLSRNKGEMMEEVSAISGKTLRRTLLSGQPVRSSYLSREYIIEAGDRVKLIIEKQGVRVQLFGEAREHGARGDKIKIYSDETRKKYEGEVIRPGVITWKKTY